MKLRRMIAIAVSNKTMANYKTPADLKGKKIGVTAPGSSTNMMVNFFLAKHGLKPSDVSIIGVGAGAGAVVGGLLGLVTGGNKTGIVQAAGAGAVIGGAGGAFTGNQAQEAVVKRCLSGRGYKVLN